MITRIHVNRHIVDRNRKHGRQDAILTVKQGRTNRYAHEVEILGPSRLVYRPEKPLPCGAQCWLETEAEVVLLEGRNE
jgi:hypothetical protein